MIIVHGTIPIKPERREQALGLAKEMAEHTRAEVGCVSYEFFVGLSDPNTLMLFQEWESMECLMDHFQTPHMETFLEALPEVVAGEITTRRYAVQAVEDGDEIEREPEPEPPPIVH
ncbi:MAG: putative quinol monooxygenase [Pseudomonadota bacterium]